MHDAYRRIRHYLIALLLCSVPLLAPLSEAAKQAATQTAQDEQEWFCQVSEVDEKWACVQDPSQVANPNPSRLPAPPKPTPRPQPAQIPERQTPQLPIPEANQVSPEFTPSEVAKEKTLQDQAGSQLPKHMRLAYQPSKPVAILDLPGDFWAAQLVALSSKQALEDYAQKFNIQGMSAARIAIDDQHYYILLLGIYETRRIAEAAMSDLPPPFNEKTPWIRSVSSLQQAMRAGDALDRQAPPR